MKSYSDFFFISLILFIVSSCSPFKNLKEGEKLLFKQSIKCNNEIDRSDLSEHYQLVPNRNILKIFPGVSLYNIGYSFFDSTKVEKKKEEAIKEFDNKIEKSKNDSEKKDKLIEKKESKLEKLEKKSKEGNWIMKMGEAPVVFDTIKINLTKKLIAHEVFSQGFFKSKVEAQIDSSNRKFSVTYQVTEGAPYIIEELLYKIPDERVDSIVKNNIDQSHIKVAERYNEDDISNELNRLTLLLTDNGYYDFEPQFIYFNVDTTKHKNKISLQTVIRNPKGKSEHPVYRIDSVFFITDENKVDSNVVFDTLYYNGSNYVFNRNSHFSKKILDRKLRIRKGDVYSQSLAARSQRNLTMLDIFRTADIQFTKDSTNHLLRARISTYTLSRFQINGETGFNIVQSKVPGPFGSINYKNRNVLRSLGVFEINLKAAIAAQASVLDPTDFLRTEEYIGQASLLFPQLYMPFFRKIKWEDYDPQTKGNVGFSIINRTEYQINTVQTGLVYSINPDNYTSILFSPIDINVIHTPRISDAFEDYLIYLQSRGNNLIESFRSSFVSDINLTYLFNNYDFHVNTKAHYFKYFLESGGTFLNIARPETLFGLETFRYLKFNTDYRFYHPVRKNTFAMRFNIGAVYPYANDHSLPYEKYFFAGGPNSMRAWRFRRLGPGSYAPIDSATGEVNDRVESPGEFLLEVNFEYRFKIVGFFEGAAFVDAGNVWMLTKDPARPGAQLKPGSFVEQIAVGTGLGLRLNFSFLLVRLDLGIKGYDPAKKKFVLFNSALRESIINIGIGYPF